MDSNDDMPSAPPKGDYQKAEKYVNKLVLLIDQNKVDVLHTDLNKFDPGSIQDHYRIDLKDYQIEVSHSKLPSSGADSFVMIFTNFKNVQEGTSEKVILAFTQLADTQFARFKNSADEQIERKRRVEEEKRFNKAVAPIDDLLDNFGNDPLPEDKKSQPTELAPAEHHKPQQQEQAAPEQPNPEPAPTQQQDLSERADNFYRAIS